MPGMTQVQAGDIIQIVRPDGHTAPGQVFPASDPKAPAVVLIQEWWGLNDQIRGVARRIADAGYNVLIPDLYRGKLASDADEAKHLMGDLDFPDALFQDLAGAVHTAKEHHGKVATLGFCMGGALSLAAAIHLQELTSAVVFYGIPPAELADPAKLRVPLLAHFADHDDWCTPDAVRKLEDELRYSTSEYEIHRYAAQHAFFNEARPEVHDPEAATTAWRRTLAFLARTLGEPSTAA
jgi:carboxymethylenebutenolidase